jgi:quercetin dioxygenase-like cupin family protein
MIGQMEKCTAVKVEHPAALDAAMRVLVGPDQGWTDHVMRVIELQVGGFSPKHTHPWPHINYVLEGNGSLFLDDQENPIQAGSYAYVPEGALHQFSNTGESVLKFICIVPLHGHK